MAKYLRNNTESEQIYNGITLEPGVITLIDNQFESKIANNEALLSNILIGNTSVSTDGSTLISDANEQINFLKGFVEDRDATGRLVTRSAATNKGWRYLAMFLEYETSTGILYCKDFEGNDLASEYNITRYDVNGAITTTAADVVEDRVTWSAPFDFEILSGNVHQPSVPIEDLRLSVGGGMFNAAANYAVIPGYYKEFVRGVNLRYTSKLETDGRATAYMAQATEGAPFQTNMMQFRIKHSAGFAHELMVSMEIFRA